MIPRLVNLTGHPARFRIAGRVGEEGEEMFFTFPAAASAPTVRVSGWTGPKEYAGPMGCPFDIPTLETTVGEVQGLPEPQEGVVYLVPRLVGDALQGKGRLDVVMEGNREGFTGAISKLIRVS